MSRRFLAWLVAFRCSPNRLVRVDRCESREAAPLCSRRPENLLGRRGCGRGCRGGWGCRERRHGLSLAHDGYAVDDDRRERFVVAVAFDVRDGGYEQDGVGVALAEDGVLAVELRYGVLSDEEL